MNRTTRQPEAVAAPPPPPPPTVNPQVRDYQTKSLLDLNSKLCLLPQWLRVNDSVKLLLLNKESKKFNSPYFKNAKEIRPQIKEIKELNPIMGINLSIDPTQSFYKQYKENKDTIEVLSGEKDKIARWADGSPGNGFDWFESCMFRQLLLALYAFYRETGAGDLSITKNSEEGTYSVKGIRHSDITVVKIDIGQTRYIGELKNGGYDGVGRMNYADGRVYVGQWQDRNMNGKGTYTYPSGTKYEGAWYKGKRHGTGKSTQADGTVYEGQCKWYRAHGQGTMKFANGDVYVGQWRAARLHGTGTLTYTDGRVYEGQFQDDNAHGQGTLTGADGNVIYDGPWSEDKMHGEGTYTYTYPSGAKYEGAWYKGKRHGFGTLTGADGKVIYEGQFENGVRLYDYCSPCSLVNYFLDKEDPQG